MHTRTLVLMAAVASTTAFAQVQVSLQVPLPTITFSAPPPLVVVQPGVQVVEDYDDEVYFSDGFYWVRRDERWFRTRDYRGNWMVVERRIVPAAVVALPPGQYRKWKGKARGDDHGHHGGDKHHGKGNKGKGRGRD